MRRALIAALAMGGAVAGHPASPRASPSLIPAPMPVATPAGSPVFMPTPLVGFRVEGDSKITPATLARLARVATGQRVSDADLARLRQALVTSELFEQSAVRLERAPGGVILVATLTDKLSWIVAPALFVLSANWAIGLAYAENNLFGEEKKLLLYAQVGSANTFFYGTYLDPAFRNSRLQLRVDTFIARREVDELANPPDDPSSTAVARHSTQDFLNAGIGVGYRHRWWLTSEVRFRGGLLTYRDVQDADGAPLIAPSPDGRDVSLQGRLTLDRRRRDFGVTDGTYVQGFTEFTVPGAATYRYAVALVRAYHSWRLWDRHQLELRSNVAVGWHLPFNEEWSLGGVADLRGYAVDQFRGDTRVFGRAEYSFPIVRIGKAAFRGLGFYDGGYIGLHATGADPDRAYLPGQVGRGYFRSNVGGGIRLYVSSVVLPLLGLDIGYGLESRAPTLYFQLGLTDF